MGKSLQIIVQVPATLRDPSLIESFGYGLHLMLVGERPCCELPKGKMVSTRVGLTPKAKERWEEIKRKNPKASCRKLATIALALVQELRVRRAKS